jgi:hypothetical protein
MEILKYNSVGSCDQLREIFRILSTSSSLVPKTDLKKYLFEKSINYAFSFEGIIEFLKFLLVIEVVRDQIRLNSLGHEIANSIDTKDIFADSLVRLFFNELRTRDFLSEFFTVSSIQYDVSSENIVINNNDIPLIFSGFRNFLLDIGFILPGESHSLLIVNPKFKDYFEHTIIPWIHESREKAEFRRHALTYETLKAIIRYKELIGYEAEKFVEQYEINRLAKHPLKRKIRAISQIDVKAGYDIVSFNSIESCEIDRFIEVKSYSKDIGFYWTKNEIDVARIKTKNYFLYLVDRANIQKKDYMPLIIQDPFANVFHNPAWFKQTELLFVSRNYSTTI